MEQVLTSPLGPILIFVLRLADVSMATLRFLAAVRGQKLVAVIVGFFEVLIWVTAVAVVVRNLNSPLLVLGYAGGFAAGTYFGMIIEERLAFGLSQVRVVSRNAGRRDTGHQIALGLRTLGFGVTEQSGLGRDGPVQILDTVVRRKQLPRVLDEIRHLDPDAFVTVEEPRYVYRGWILSRRRK